MDENSKASKPKDPRWHRIADHAPSELVAAIIRNTKGYKIENLTKGTEVLIDELFRVASDGTVQALYEEFPGPDNFAVWFYATDLDLKKPDVDKQISLRIDPRLASERLDIDI